MDAVYIFLLVANIIFMYFDYKDEDWFVFSVNCLGAIGCLLGLMN